MNTTNVFKKKYVHNKYKRQLKNWHFKNIIKNIKSYICIYKTFQNVFNSSYFRKIKQTHDRGRFHLSLQTTASNKRGKTILISVKKAWQAEQIVEAEDRGFNQWSVAKYN